MERLYSFTEEKIPRDAQEPTGNGLKITTEVDADHAHDLEIRMSVKGYFSFLGWNFTKLV